MTINKTNSTDLKTAAGQRNEKEEPSKSLLIHVRSETRQKLFTLKKKKFNPLPSSPCIVKKTFCTCELQSSESTCLKILNEKFLWLTPSNLIEFIQNVLNQHNVQERPRSSLSRAGLPGYNVRCDTVEIQHTIRETTVWGIHTVHQNTANDFHIDLWPSTADRFQWCN